MCQIFHQAYWFVIFSSLAIGFVFVTGALAQQSGPMTLKDVREAIETLPDSRVRVLINQLKVDFDLTPEIETDFKKRGVSPETLDLIRVKRVIPKASLDILCKPVDCEVFVNDTRVGTTSLGRLKKGDQDPARITVSVRAVGYKEQSTILQLVANSNSVYEFSLERLPPPTPARVDPPPPARVTPTPIVPTPAPTPTLTPVPTPAPPPVADGVTPQQLLNRVVEACGGVAALKDFAKYTATADLTLVTGRGPQTNAQLKELVSYPKSIKWELRMAGANWTVTNSPEATWSDGDAKFRGSDLGQELERNIKMFVTLHLALALTRFQESDVRLSLAPASGTLSVLVAQTNDDRYTVTVDSSNRPVRIAHEALTGLQPKTEMVYGRYEAQGKVTLPMSMTLRYANQPDYGHEIRYLKIDPTAKPKDGDFSRRRLFGVLPAK